MIRLLLLFFPLILNAQVSPIDEKLLKVEEQNSPKEQQDQTSYQRPQFQSHWSPWYRPWHQTPYEREAQSIPFSIGGQLGFPLNIQPPLFGLYTTIGDQRALYLSAATSKQNPHNHYTNITRAQVIEWGDTIQSTYNQRTDFAIGITIRQESPISHTLGINLYTLNQDLIIKDPLNILPYPGEDLYSIDLNKRQGINILYGFMYHYNGIEMGMQCLFLNRPVLQATVGIQL
jgi:hypothetical protein